MELDHEEMVKNGKREGRYTWKATRLKLAFFLNTHVTYRCYLLIESVYRSR